MRRFLHLRATRVARAPAAFVLTEVILGIGLVGVLIMTLSVMVTRQNKAAARMAGQRELLRAAEQGLLATQSPDVPPPADAGVVVTPLDHPSPVPRRRWVIVTATHEDRSASITGLAREELLGRAAGGRP